MPPAPSDLAVRSVRVLGHAPRLAGEHWRMVGQDGGQSIPCGDRSLFVFADTLLAPSALPLGAAAEPDVRSLLARRQGIFLGNCAAWAPSGGSLLDALSALRYLPGELSDQDSRPREFLATTALERLAGWRLWPQHGLFLDGRVLLFYMAIRPTGSGGLMDHEHQGAGLALLDPLTGLAERLRFHGDWRLWPDLPTTVHLGVQVLQHDDWVYVYASRDIGLAFDGFVCRVRPDDLANPSRYEFLAGDYSDDPRWSHDWRAGHSLGPCGREFSVSWNPHLRRFLMLFLDPFDRSLRLRSAPHPSGPFSPATVLSGRVPCDARTELVSLGFEHPQYAQSGGRELAISYSQPRFLQNTLIAATLR